MKFKREIIAIILIICMLFTISAISAADSNTTAVSAVNESVKVSSIDIAGDNNLAKSNGDVEILGEPDNGSLVAFQKKFSTVQSGDTVYLENDYILMRSISKINVYVKIKMYFV